MSLQHFLNSHNLHLLSQLAKGWTSYVYLVEGHDGRKYAVKILREKSNRKKMVGQESRNLQVANSAGIGPRFVLADLENDLVMMEYIEGVPFTEWILSGPQKPVLENFISKLLEQADRLDRIGLDHGQLAGKGHNILVRNGLPVIIDFEKASTKRKVHNRNVLESFLYRSRHSSLVKMINEILA